MALVGGGQSTGGQAAAPAVADDKAEFKAKKLAALKRFKERKAEKAKENYQNALKLRDELTKQGMLDKLSASMKEFVISLCADPSVKAASGGAGTSSIFTAIFGSNPEVGKSVTLEQAFLATGCTKGKATIDIWVKRWAEKGTIVEFVKKDPMIQSTYTIKALAK